MRNTLSQFSCKGGLLWIPLHIKIYSLDSKWYDPRPRRFTFVRIIRLDIGLGFGCASWEMGFLHTLYKDKLWCTKDKDRHSRRWQKKPMLNGNNDMGRDTIVKDTFKE